MLYHKELGQTTTTDKALPIAPAILKLFVMIPGLPCIFYGSDIKWF
jgi:hypothetical protein